MSMLTGYLFPRRFLLLLLCLALSVTPVTGYAQSFFISTLPEPGARVGLSGNGIPVLLKGLVFHPDQPLQLDFIVDSGQDRADDISIRQQSRRMARYFLAAITVPERQLWVNLSPYEKDRIIEEPLGRTLLGRDMLAQDYLLKQVASSLIYPESPLGREFWSRVYAEAQEKFATSDLPLDCFHKIWIVPGQSEVFVKGDAVYITRARLKVMLDADYQSSVKELPAEEAARRFLIEKVLREVVIPRVEQEVNEGAGFAVIRQIYHAAILAKWYRGRIQGSFLAGNYMDRNLVSGVLSGGRAIKQALYQRYLAAFRKGVFDYIREDKSAEGNTVERRYFSGGERLDDIRLVEADAAAVSVDGQTFRVRMVMSPPHDAAQSHYELQEESRVAAARNVLIARLVDELNNLGIHTSVEGQDLGAFIGYPALLVQSIQDRTILKRAEDIYRILLWRLHAERNIRQGSPKKPVLGGMDSQKAVQLFNAFFNQEAMIDSMASEVKPLNVVFFHQGGQRSLTRKLKARPNVNIRIFASGSGDGLSWFYGARVFNATGITAAGRALVDLSRDSNVADFCDARFPEKLSADVLENEFYNLVQSLFDPGKGKDLRPEIRKLFNLAISMDVGKRQAIAGYLEAFLQNWKGLPRVAGGAREFSLHDVPIRTLLLLGMVQKRVSEGGPEDWQGAVESLGELLDVRKGHKVLFPVHSRGFLVGLTQSGLLLTSQTALNYYSKQEEMRGLWLVDPSLHKQLRENDSINGILVSGYKDAGLADDRTRQEIQETTRKVSEREIESFAAYLSSAAMKDRLEPEAEEALSKADILFYSGNIETDVGGVLVVPGGSQAIARAGRALKVLVPEDHSPEAVARLPAALGKISMYSHMQDSSLPPLGSLVDYVLAGVQEDARIPDLFVTLRKIEAQAGHRVRALSVRSSDGSSLRSTASFTALIDSVLTLRGLQQAGLALSSTTGLISVDDVRGKESELGLFHGKRTVTEMIRYIIANWTQIRDSGAFVFDVDKTILPKGSGGLGEYRELAHLFMLLLRMDVRVAIISGNSRKEQMKRIYQAIREEMRDHKQALQKLTLYVDGGATKVGFSQEGEARLYNEYNLEHSVPLQGIGEALRTVLSAANLREWLGDAEGYARAVQAYIVRESANARIDFPWQKDDDWQAEILTPEEVSRRLSAGEALPAPWIEVRGEEEVVRAGHVSSVTVRPLPPFQQGAAQTDVRPKVRAAVVLPMREEDATDGIYYKMGAAGTSSIDMTSSRAGKALAMVDFIETNNLDPGFIFYFADELYRYTLENGETIVGNDFELTQDERLSRVRFLGVNTQGSRGKPDNVTLIGLETQATFEFLQLVIDARADAAMDNREDERKGGIDIRDIDLKGARNDLLSRSEIAQNPVQPGFTGFQPDIVEVSFVADPLRLLNSR